MKESRDLLTLLEDLEAMSYNTTWSKTARSSWIVSYADLWTLVAQAAGTKPLKDKPLKHALATLHNENNFAFSF